MSFLNHLVDLLHQHAQGQTHQGPGVNPTGPVMHGDVRQQVAINHAAGGFPGGGAMETLGDVTVRPQDAQFLQGHQRQSFGFGYPGPQGEQTGLPVMPNFGMQKSNFNPQHTLRNLQVAAPPLQGYNQDDQSQGIQGGMVNQGYIPLQSTRFKRR